MEVAAFQASSTIRSSSLRRHSSRGSKAPRLEGLPGVLSSCLGVVFSACVSFNAARLLVAKTCVCKIVYAQPMNLLLKTTGQIPRKPPVKTSENHRSNSPKTSGRAGSAHNGAARVGLLPNANRALRGFLAPARWSAKANRYDLLHLHQLLFRVILVCSAFVSWEGTRLAGDRSIGRPKGTRGILYVRQC